MLGTEGSLYLGNYSIMRDSYLTRDPSQPSHKATARQALALGMTEKEERCVIVAVSGPLPSDDS